MGLLDNLVRAIDSGNLEKTVAGAVDSFESGVSKAVGTVDTVVSRLEASDAVNESESK